MCGVALYATQEVPSAAQQLCQIAQARAGAGAAAHGEAPEIPGVSPVGLVAVLDGVQRGQILLIVRLHGHRPADVLQSRHLIAQALIGQRAEVVPFCVPVGAVVQGVDRLPVASKPDILAGRLLVAVPFRLCLPGLIVPAPAEGL